MENIQRGNNSPASQRTRGTPGTPSRPSGSGSGSGSGASASSSRPSGSGAPERNPLSSVFKEAGRNFPHHFAKTTAQPSDSVDNFNNHIQNKYGRKSGVTVTTLLSNNIEMLLKQTDYALTTNSTGAGPSRDSTGAGPSIDSTGAGPSRQRRGLGYTTTHEFKKNKGTCTGQSLIFLNNILSNRRNPAKAIDADEKLSSAMLQAFGDWGRSKSVKKHISEINSLIGSISERGQMKVSNEQSYSGARALGVSLSENYRRFDDPAEIFDFVKENPGGYLVDTPGHTMAIYKGDNNTIYFCDPDSAIYRFEDSEKAQNFMPDLKELDDSSTVLLFKFQRS